MSSSIQRRLSEKYLHSDHVYSETTQQRCLFKNNFRFCSQLFENNPTRHNINLYR